MPVGKQDPNKEIIFSLVIAILCLILSINVLFDPIGQIKSRKAKGKLVEELTLAREYLPIARAKWEERNIKHYSFEFAAYPGVCLTLVKVEVQDDKVVRMNYGDIATGMITEKEVPLATRETSFCGFSTLTIPVLFDEAEIYMNYEIDDICVYKIVFDPIYDFVTSTTCEVYHHNKGWLSGVIFDNHSFAFRVKNFQILEE